jgi:hypothetical protein
MCLKFVSLDKSSLDNSLIGSWGNQVGFEMTELINELYNKKSNQ